MTGNEKLRRLVVTVARRRGDERITAHRNAGASLEVTAPWLDTFATQHWSSARNAMRSELDDALELAALWFRGRLAMRAQQFSVAGSGGR